MEATPGPMLEPLTDLPVEEPVEGAPTLQPARNTSASSGGAAARTAAEAPKAPPGAATAGDELINPEDLLAASEPLSVAPERDTAASSVAASGAAVAARDDAGIGSSELVDPE